jgi:hypothetical protein
VYSIARRGLRRLLQVPDPSIYLEDAAFYSEERYPWLAGAWAQHLANLRAFKDLAAEHRAELLIVLMPTKAQVYPFLFGGQKIDLEQPNRKLAEFLKKEQIRYIDLLPSLRRYADPTPRQHLRNDQDFFWRNDGHLNIPGNHLVGLLVARLIVQHRMLGSPTEQALTAIETELKRFERRVP